MLALDPKKIRKFSNKEYRDSYLETHVRSGIAYQIQALRENLGDTQAQFAQRLGTTQSAVSRLENPEDSRASVTSLLEVAAKLDIALLVRFVDYNEFLRRTADTSPEAMAVRPFAETIWSPTLSGRSGQENWIQNASTGSARRFTVAPSGRASLWTKTPLLVQRSFRNVGQNTTETSTQIIATSPSGLLTRQ